MRRRSLARYTTTTVRVGPARTREASILQAAEGVVARVHANERSGRAAHGERHPAVADGLPQSPATRKETRRRAHVIARVATQVAVLSRPFPQNKRKRNNDHNHRAGLSAIDQIGSAARKLDRRRFLCGFGSLADEVPDAKHSDGRGVT